MAFHSSGGRPQADPQSPDTLWRTSETQPAFWAPFAEMQQSIQALAEQMERMGAASSQAPAQPPAPMRGRTPPPPQPDPGPMLWHHAQAKSPLGAQFAQLQDSVDTLLERMERLERAVGALGALCACRAKPCAPQP